MYRNYLFVILIFFCLISVGQAQTPINSYEYLKLEIENEISFGVSFEDNYNVNKFDVNSFFFPQTYADSQFLNSFESSNKNNEIINNSGIYSLGFNYDKSNLKSKNTITNNFVVESVVTRPEIRTKISYPLNYVGSSYLQYLDFGEFIDIDDSIKAQASLIASGEDDVYIVASKVAKWIREDVNYDLSTLTQNPNQKSSEVFKSKSGVCREITNLYVSMMRSLGIPSRVVTGYAYTNSDDLVDLLNSNWGGHAWAEVLIGDTWVPFDLTYNQYGFVDASHIVLDKYKYIRSSAVTINATGFGFSLKRGSLTSDTDFEITGKKESIFDRGFNINIEGPEEIGYGSYGYVKVNVENTKDFYQIIFLNLASAPEVELLNADSRMVIFEPNEEKEIYFKFKLPEDLSPGFKYTFPFTIYNNFIEQTYNVYSQEDYLSIREIGLPEEEIEEKLITSNKLKLGCNSKFNSTGNYANCFLKNTNNFEIEDAKICSSSECKSISLKLNEVVEVDFRTSKDLEKVSYVLGEDSEEVEVKIVEPDLEYNWNIDGGLLQMDYKISNYYKGLGLKVLIQDLLVEDVDVSSVGRVILELPPGSSNVKLELYDEGRVYDVEEFNLSLQVESGFELASNDVDSQSFFSLIKEFFLLVGSLFKSS